MSAVAAVFNNRSNTTSPQKGNRFEAAQPQTSRWWLVQWIANLLNWFKGSDSIQDTDTLKDNILKLTTPSLLKKAGLDYTDISKALNTVLSNSLASKLSTSPLNTLNTLLNIAMIHNYPLLVKSLLQLPGIDINLTTKYGTTPVMFIAMQASLYRDNHNTLKSLIAKGANVNAVNTIGNNALMSIITILQKKPTLLNLPTARQVISDLVNAGTNLDHKNKDGLNAQDYVNQINNPDFTKWFNDVASDRQPSQSWLSRLIASFLHLFNGGGASKQELTTPTKQVLDEINNYENNRASKNNTPSLFTKQLTKEQVIAALDRIKENKATENDRALMGELLYRAINAQAATLFELLLKLPKNAINIDWKNPLQETTPLMTAAYMIKPTYYMLQLLNKGANANAVDKRGNNALILISQRLENLPQEGTPYLLYSKLYPLLIQSTNLDHKNKDGRNAQYYVNQINNPDFTKWFNDRVNAKKSTTTL